MGMPIVKVAAGGLPVTIATTGGLPCTEATNGFGIAVTEAPSGAGGLAVTGFTFGPDVTAPVITSSNSVSNIENTVLAHTLTANEPVTWAIVAGGADNTRFELSGNTLRWLSNGTKDFEAPDDTGLNNTYVVNVRATDLAANPSTTQTITVTVTNVTGVAPAAPVLDLLTDGTDNTPDFTLTGDLALSDTVRFQYGTASDFTGASELTNAIDAGEDAANAISFSTGSLANGTWYFRARIERPGAEGAAISGWSNTETIAISVVSSYTGPGDVVTTGWAAWVGFRAFSAATRGGVCCRVAQVGSPFNEQDFSTDATTGMVDTVAIATFVALSVGNAGVINRLYDQTGNGRHVGPGTGSGAGTANYDLTAVGSFPALYSSRLQSAAIGADFSQPFTFVAVGAHRSGEGQGLLLHVEAQMTFGLGGADDTVYLYAGSVVSAAATSDTTHSLIGVFNGGSSVLRVNNTETGGDAGAGTINDTDPITLSGWQALYTFEGGIISTSIDATQRGNLAANIIDYYGL